MWWNVSPRSQHDETERFIFIDKIFDMISEFGLNGMEKLILIYIYIYIIQQQNSLKTKATQIIC